MQTHKPRALQVVRRARLYETAPAYVENQPQFLNTAVAARTRLPPDQLLSALKAVEVLHQCFPHLRSCIAISSTDVFAPLPAIVQLPTPHEPAIVGCTALL